MDITFGVVKDMKVLYSTNFIDNLLINLLIGLNNISSDYLSDSLQYIELEKYSVSVSFSEDKFAFICVNKKKEMIDLSFFIESYRKCNKEDISLLDKLLLDYYCFKK